ncbi:MAG TPA: YqaA family protein [Candidatus Polarisedimenticolaceae bacterium]|nr:YqaA family protein [Candidatus Polarisedimenticolaceae bacterium]
MSGEPRPRGGLHYRLYDWVLHWSAHRHAQSALFVLSFAEASFFPVPPDVLLMSMTLARPVRAVRYALIATIGSVTGGLAGYAIGYGFWTALEPYAYRYLHFMKFTPEVFAAVQHKYQANAFLALFMAGFTPIPYKIFTVAAGVFGVAIPVFIVASLIGRAGRFLLVALLLRFAGPTIKPFLDRYLGWLTIAFVALLILGFWVVGLLGNA